MRQFLMRTLVLMACLVMFAVPVVHARRVEVTSVTVTQARAVTDGRSVAVEITIEPQTWRWIQERRIELVLSVWLDGRRTDLKLRSARDTLTFPLPRRLGNLGELRIALGGQGSRTTIGAMIIGGIEVTEVTLKVSRGQVVGSGGEAPPPAPAPPPPPPNWSANPAVIKACDDTMTGSGNQEACLDAVRRYMWPPEPMVRACYRAMTGSTNTLACIRSGSAMRSSGVGALEACYRAMTGNANTLACLDSVTRSVLEPSPAIDACAKAVTGGSDTLACIGLTIEARSDPTAAIASCQQAMTGDAAVLGCVKRALAPR